MMGRIIASRELAEAWVFFPGQVQREQEAAPPLGTCQGSAPAPAPAPAPLVGLRESVHRELRSTGYHQAKG